MMGMVGILTGSGRPLDARFIIHSLLSLCFPAPRRLLLRSYAIGQLCRDEAGRWPNRNRPWSGAIAIASRCHHARYSPFAL